MAWLSLEELKKYDAKKELKKMGQAEKSAASLRSGGQPVEVVRDTGAKDAVKNLLEKHKKSRAIRKELQSIGQDTGGRHRSRRSCRRSCQVQPLRQDCWKAWAATPRTRR